jgi:hypothetical protein
LDPLAMLAFTVGLDFEDDQWTFFKPPAGDLRALYGLDVQELNVWKPLLEHAVPHLRAGKLVLTEADAFHLPDTQGTDYRRAHTKTTIVLETLDVEARQLGYFHNAGYFTLEGEDFDGVFRRAQPMDPFVLPLFAEYVRLDRVERLAPAELAARSRALLAGHLARRPVRNPFTRFAPVLAAELVRLQGVGVDAYHLYAAWAWTPITCMPSPRCARWARTSSCARRTCAGWTATRPRPAWSPRRWSSSPWRRRRRCSSSRAHARWPASARRT